MQREATKQAQQRLEKVCKRLERPTVEALDRCTDDLADTITYLSSLQRERPTAPDEREKLAAEIGEIRQGIARATILLEAAGRFYSGWARLAALGTDGDVAPSNYSSSGKVVPIHPGTVVMDG